MPVNLHRNRRGTAKKSRPAGSGKVLPWPSVLLPLPPFGVSVSFSVDLKFEKLGDSIEPGELRGSRIIVNRTPVSYRAASHELSHARAFPCRGGAILREHNPLAFSIQAAVCP